MVEGTQRILTLLLSALLLAGCVTAPGYQIPVDNRTLRAGEIPKSYTVRSGDSLYMIAMEFDLNYLELGRWNGLKSPYTIHRGQVLRLHPPQRIAKRVQPKKSSRATKSINSRTESGGSGQRGCRGGYYTVQRGDTLSEVAQKCGLTSRTLARWNGLKSPYTIHVKQKLRLKASPSQPLSGNSKSLSGSSQRVQQSAATQPRQSRPTAAVEFSRPVSGKISQRFSQAKGVTGVEFSGQQGDPVRAAAAGKVVYSGTGLVRYGKLLIIKHDNNLLTAYAHNSALQVAEGERVEAGQQIAKMGSSGTDRVKLHFEVRKGGKPVDPMRYLKEP
jgi:lipoprotein NlpD